ncbi:MAG TPA: SgcJ/EcaC family oxidoreductase [Nitrososphaeraceae archaeon]|nr:SgcJ/EcaC family oxidoreductase [Nitrososphaeraceae archaeon]
MTREPNIVTDEKEVSLLYQELLKRWNKRRASEMTDLFTEDGNLVGFDGSQINGRSEARSVLSQIFANHQTAAYLGIVKEVRLLSPDVAILRAVAGMVPPEESAIIPEINAVQILVAVKQQNNWIIALFQNTPAAFHGRPELSERLTEELRQALRTSSNEND